MVLSEEDYAVCQGDAPVSGLWIFFSHHHCVKLDQASRFVVPFVMSNCERLSAQHECQLRAQAGEA